MTLQEYFDVYDINMTDLAKISGLSKATIHNITKGKRDNISLSTAIKIQFATENEVKCADLLGYQRMSLIARNIDKRLDKYNKGLL